MTEDKNTFAKGAEEVNTTTQGVDGTMKVEYPTVGTPLKWTAAFHIKGINDFKIDWLVSGLGDLDGVEFKNIFKVPAWVAKHGGSDTTILAILELYSHYKRMHKSMSRVFMDHDFVEDKPPRLILKIDVKPSKGEA